MEDFQIVDLYWARNEKAISESERKYGRMLKSLSHSILTSREDAEECVNDTYLAAWQSMPTERPSYLGAFLSKITRNLSIDRYRRSHREKRGGVDNLMAELSECIPGGEMPDEALDYGVLAEQIGAYLSGLKPAVRQAFVGRYFFALSLQEIADRQGVTLSWVKTALHRTRQGLREYLEKEGYFV